MKPMFAEIGSTNILNNKNYLFEPKLDGIRIILKKNKEKVQIFNRLGKDITARYKHLDLAFALRGSATVDGELVVYDDQGNPDFTLMQQSQSDKSITPTFVVFDILEFEGKNLQNKSVIARKKYLKKAVKPNKQVQLMIYTLDGKKLWKWIRKRKAEGIIAKELTSPYLQQRSKLWLKIKTVQSIDAAIIGYSKRKKSFALGLKSDVWIHIGNVGSGLNDQEYRELIKQLTPQSRTILLPPFIQQVKPKLVCEVEYLQVTKDKKLRAPVFLHLRADKKPEECTFAQLPLI